VGEADGVVAVGEGGADGEGTVVAAAGVDVAGSGAAVAAEADGVAQVRRLGAGVRVVGVHPDAEGFVAAVVALLLRRQAAADDLDNEGLSGSSLARRPRRSRAAGCPGRARAAGCAAAPRLSRCRGAPIRVSSSVMVAELNFSSRS